uniref:C-type lectin domain-containing protein n=1 Tax=Poecilia latipinna TaxID=48699 RepID=A0A3B3VL71_9TELE
MPLLHGLFLFYFIFTILSLGALFCNTSGWRQHGSNCYKFKSETMKSWSAARHDCVEEGGDLVSITSQAENTYVMGTLSSTHLDFWIGLSTLVRGTCRGKERLWTDGSPFRYIHSKICVSPAGSPDDYFGEDCLSILINGGYWNDDNCQNKRGYICKRRGEECCLKRC